MIRASCGGFTQHLLQCGRFVPADAHRTVNFGKCLDAVVGH